MVSVARKSGGLGDLSDVDETFDENLEKVEITIVATKSYDFYLDNHTIKNVNPNGVSGKAGLLEGDIILEIDKFDVQYDRYNILYAKCF